MCTHSSHMNGKLLGTPEVPQMCALSSHMNGGSHHKFN